VNAYSQDLREKIVEAVFERGMAKSETARAFGVSLSSVKRYAKAASEGKSLAPKKKPGSKPKLDEQARGGSWRRTLRNVPSSPSPRGGIT
jgi:transposase